MVLIRIFIVAVLSVVACDQSDSKKIPAPKPTDIALTLGVQVSPVSKPMAAYAPLVYQVSTTESVALESGYMVISKLRFADMEGCEMSGDCEEVCRSEEQMDRESVSQMGQRFSTLSGGHIHSDSDATSSTGTQSGEGMKDIEAAGPFVVNLTGEPTVIGTFGIPQGSYGRFELSFGPSESVTGPSELVGLSLYLKGVYSSPTTTIPFIVQFTRARKVVLMPMGMGEMGMAPQMMDSQMGMESMSLDRDMVADLHFDTSRWFESLTFGAAATTTSSLVITDGSAVSSLLLDRIAASARLGLDTNGDGKVGGDEYQAITMEGCMTMKCQDM